MPHILLVKTSSMGDVIHNLAVIADIRVQHPNATFDWLVEESFAEIPALHHCVKNVITVAVRRWRKQLFSVQTWREIFAVKTRIQSTHYDAVIDTQGLIKSALFTWLANGETHGMDKHSARESFASLFYKHCHAVPRGQHAVARNRALAALSLGYPIPENAPDYGLKAIDFKETSPAIKLTTPYAVCLHATSRDAKLWPIEHWVTLGNQLNQQGLSIVLPWASPAEQARANTIAQQVTHAVVLPKLGLRDIAQILSKANVAIGVDTGLIHLATALHIPSIAIYTDTNPNLTGIYPALGASAVNVGGKAQIPSPQIVLNELSAMLEV